MRPDPSIVGGADVTGDGITVRVSLNTTIASAMTESLASLKHVLDLALNVAEVTFELPVIDTDLGSLAALRATDQGLALEPTDSFRNLVAAVLALNVNAEIAVVERHGWPILSSVPANSDDGGRAGGVNPPAPKRSTPIAALRRDLGLTLEQFGARIGLASKGNVSIIERGGRCSVKVALAIEALSGGSIPAGTINTDVALVDQARRPIPTEAAEVA